MKEIQLTQGKVTLVDDDVYEELNKFKWYAHLKRNVFYAQRAILNINGKQKTIYIHHEIIGMPPNGFETDHRDGDGLRNLRSNLRHVTSRQNSQNRKHLKKTSKYPGVSWNKAAGKWRAQIYINKKQTFLGCFADETEAFEVYSKAINNLGEKLL